MGTGQTATGQTTGQSAVLRPLEDLARNIANKEYARQQAIKQNPSLNTYYNGLGSLGDDAITAYSQGVQQEYTRKKPETQSQTTRAGNVASASGNAGASLVGANTAGKRGVDFRQANIDRFRSNYEAEQAAEQLRRDNYDIDAGQARIDQAKAELEELEAAAQEAYEATLSARGMNNAATMKQAQDAEAAYQAKAEEIKQMERQHESDSQYVRMREWDTFSQSDEFADYAAQGAAIENPTWNQSKGSTSIFGWQPFAKDIQNPVSFWRSDEVKGRGENWADSEGSLYNYMSDSEVDMYNALLARDMERGTNDAQLYLDGIQETLSARKGGYIASELDDDKLNQYFYGAVSGVERWKSGNAQAWELFKGNDEALTRPSTMYGSPLVRQDVADDGKLWGTAYDVVENIANNAVPAVVGTVASAIAGPKIGRTVGQAAFGPSVYGNTYRDEVRPMIGSGETARDPEQAKVKAALTTASELALGEAIGGIPGVGGVLGGHAISALAKGINSAVGRAGIRMLGNSIGEFTEETLQDIIEPVLDNIAYGEHNKVEVTPESLYSGAIGAITSMLMGGPGILFYRRHTQARAPLTKTRFPSSGRAQFPAQCAEKNRSPVRRLYDAPWGFH